MASAAQAISLEFSHKHLSVSRRRSGCAPSMANCSADELSSLGDESGIVKSMTTYDMTSLAESLADKITMKGWT